MSDKQLEFDFEQYQEPRRVSAPVTEYFRKAFDLEIIADPNMRRHQVAFVQSGPLRPHKIKDDKHLQELIDGVPVAVPSRTCDCNDFPDCDACRADYNRQVDEIRGRIEDGATVDDKAFSSDPILSTDSVERKNTPIFSGVLMYFPLAIAAVARHSKRGNDRHNPTEPLHWAREKSADHHDCAARHLIDSNHFNDESGEYEEAAALAWRALAILELLEEKRLGRG